MLKCWKWSDKCHMGKPIFRNGEMISNPLKGEGLKSDTSILN